MISPVWLAVSFLAIMGCSLVLTVAGWMFIDWCAGQQRTPLRDYIKRLKQRV